MNNPSVTTVLNPYTDFSRIHPEVLRHAAQRGTRIHNAAAAHLQGLWVMPMDSDAQIRFDSFRRWADIMVDKVIWVEKELYCDCYGYIGHPDCCLVLKDGPGAVLVDWKSPITASKSWPIQISAYCHLVEKHGGLPKGSTVDRCGAIMLSSTGKIAKMVEYTQSRNIAFSVFLAALTTWKYFNKGGK